MGLDPSSSPSPRASFDSFESFGSSDSFNSSPCPPPSFFSSSPTPLSDCIRFSSSLSSIVLKNQNFQIRHLNYEVCV